MILVSNGVKKKSIKKPDDISVKQKLRDYIQC